ncbi:MAG TPA: PAS domain S-box protein [Solimonas sp.]|nr:PAS domain S-box protein [Solimonas sp.]
MTATAARPDASVPDSWYQAMVEAAPDAMLLADASGQIVVINGQLEKLFGYARSELLGELIEKLMPENSMLKHVSLRDGYLMEPRTRQMSARPDVRGKRKDGTEFPIDISLSPLRTPQGIFVIAAMRNATATSRSREQLKSFIESVADAVVVVDETGKMVLANQRTENIFGYIRQAIHGKPFDFLLPERSRTTGKDAPSFLDNLQAQGPGSPHQLWARRRDGCEFPAEMCLSHLEIESGAHYVVSIRDLTQRRLTFSEVAALLAGSDRPGEANVARVLTSRTSPKASVLVVDDDPMDLTLICQALDQLADAVDVERASGGQQALKSLSPEREPGKPLPRMVLLDWNLPDLHGRDVMAQLRTDPRLANIPVVLVSGSETHKDKDEALKLGIRHFVYKGGEFDELRTALTDVVGSALAPLPSPIRSDE